jgi:hypothetical protein
LSSLKPLPKEREVGSGVKKLESQGISGTAKPGEQEEAEQLDFDFPFPPEPLPPATYVNPLKIDRRDKSTGRS